MIVDTTSPAAVTRILVPLDGSERAEEVLPYVQATGGPDAEITLLEVVPKASDVRNVFGKVIATPDRVQQGYADVARKNLERAQGKLAGQKQVQQQVVQGDPAEQILQMVEAQGIDLIAMASQGQGAWGPWALGSIVDRVVRRTQSLVLVVPPGNNPSVTASPQTIVGLLVPTDGSTIAAQALPVAAGWARTLKVPVRVVHAISIDIAESPDDEDQARESTRRTEAMRGLDDAVKQLQSAGIDASSEVLTGDPVAAIISTANPGDLIVLTKQGEGGRWELGSVAGNLLRAGVLPLLLVPTNA